MVAGYPTRSIEDSYPQEAIVFFHATRADIALGVGNPAQIDGTGDQT
jgi:hypothetical protein